MLNIAEKINKLPQKVQDSLLSDFGNQLENEIFEVGSFFREISTSIGFEERAVS